MTVRVLFCHGLESGPLGRKVVGLREAGFAVVIDINLRENAFNKLIEYLEDGFFIDKYTKNLKVEVLTYNGELRYFCNLVVDFDFSQGGNIQVEYSADSAATQPYYHDPDDETGALVGDGLSSAMSGTPRAAAAAASAPSASTESAEKEAECCRGSYRMAKHVAARASCARKAASTSATDASGGSCTTSKSTRTRLWSCARKMAVAE